MEDPTKKTKLEKISSEQEKNIQEVFTLCPELEKIGNPEQYGKYLETIFPESKVKNILWHATAEKVDNYHKERVGAHTGEENKNQGLYFADHKGAVILKSLLPDAKIVLPNVVNLKNPQTVKELSIYVNPEEHDGILSQEILEDPLGDTVIPVFVAFHPEQAYILGSQSDIEKFKEFVASENK
jgi:hypothetical protein